MMLDKELALRLQIIKAPDGGLNEQPKAASVDYSSKLKSATATMVFSSLVALAAVQLSDIVYPVQETETNPTVVVDGSTEDATHSGTGYRHMGDKASEAMAAYISSKWKVSTEMAGDIVSVVDEAGFDADIDPIILLAIIAEESSFNTEARSHVGAEGLMQVWRRWHPEKFTGINKPTYEQNIVIGTAILKEYLEREQGNLASALQRYNGNKKDSRYTYASKVLNTKVSFDSVYLSAQTRKLTRS